MTALSPGRPEDQQHNGAGRLDVPSDASSSPGPAGHEPGNPAGDDTSQPPDGTGDDDWVPL